MLSRIKRQNERSGNDSNQGGVSTEVKETKKIQEQNEEVLITLQNKPEVVSVEETIQKLENLDEVSHASNPKLEEVASNHEEQKPTE